MATQKLVAVENTYKNESGFINVQGTPLKFGEVRQSVLMDTEIENLKRANFIEIIEQKK